MGLALELGVPKEGKGGYGTVEGFVTDEAGNPVVNAHVFVEDSVLLADFTNASGGYRIEDVPSGVQKINAWATGNLTLMEGIREARQTVIITVFPNEDHEVNFTLKKGESYTIDLTPEPPGEGEGKNEFGVLDVLFLRALVGCIFAIFGAAVTFSRTSFKLAVLFTIIVIGASIIGTHLFPGMLILSTIALALILWGRKEFQWVPEGDHGDYEEPGLIHY
jgi:hypothetical protein